MRCCRGRRRTFQVSGFGQAVWSSSSLARNSTEGNKLRHIGVYAHIFAHLGTYSLPIPNKSGSFLNIATSKQKNQGFEAEAGEEAAFKKVIHICPLTISVLIVIHGMVFDYNKMFMKQFIVLLIARHDEHEVNSVFFRCRELNI